MTREALNLNITGIVQGVGFRPFVYREAVRHDIAGWVLNNVEGVRVHAEGKPDDLDAFTIALSENAPAAAQVREISIAEASLEGFRNFEIRFSQDSAPDETTLVSPDLATCDECAAELVDPGNRRYRYPFINCTNCGPRFTIMRGLPYDRPATSMEPFTMCPECQGEYDDPANRRFHAQPDACFECGPHVGWIANGAPESAAYVAGTAPSILRQENILWAHNRAESDCAFARAVAVLEAGGIVAVKGLGGYHLACDACNEEAILRLRARKHREGKAFAVMVADVAAAREACQVSDAEEAQLKSPARPIVLCRKRPDAEFAEGLVDDLPEVGLMLPATPVQHLLLHDFGGALVMTSGNIHDEPIVIDEDAAFEQLGGVADAFLVNDRAIEGRYDDSVLRVLDAGQAGEVVQMVRRARGFAPLPVELPEECAGADGAGEARPCVLAVGSEQKNTFTVTRGNLAFVSQHIGDVESVAVSDAWDETRRRFTDLFRLTPERLACDFHPEYLTSKWAAAQSAPCMKVQHHHAHILSVMGENKLVGPVCGFAFDGTGYGLDGAIWGGEVLLCNLQAYERFANFAYIPLPGGAAAIKDPVRIAYGALWAFDLLDHPAAKRFVAQQVPYAELYEKVIERGINCPQTSSVGRLFDAASALLGICSRPRYEGEAAILLEASLWKEVEGLPLASRPADAGTSAFRSAETPISCSSEAPVSRPSESPAPSSRPSESPAPSSRPSEASGGISPQPSGTSYRFDLLKNTATENSTAADTSVLLVDAAPVFRAMLDDMEARVPVGLIARRFHDAVVDVLETLALLVRATYGINTVALAGGVFMNRYLAETSLRRLQKGGFTVALNRDLPPNDGSISYGQAVLALAAAPEE